MKHNWEYKRLDEVCASRAFSDTIEQVDGKVWLLNLDMIESNTGTILSKLMCREDEVSGSVTTFGKNFVLYSKLRPYLNKVVVPETSGYCTTELVPLIPNDNLNKFYLSYFLRNKKFVNHVNEKASGAKMPRAKMSEFWSVLIPVPPMEVQEQIVEELDKINEIISDCKEAIRNLDSLAQSLFYDYFGDPITNPKGWEVKKLGEICETQLGKMINQKVQKGILKPFLCAGNILDNSFNLTDLKEFCIQDNEKDKYSVRTGDLMISEGGDAGRCAIWNKDIEMYFQKSVHRVRSSHLITIYLLYLLRNLKMIGVLTEKSKGATIQHLTQNTLNSLELMIPPLELQKKFAERVEQIEQQKKGLEETIANMQTLLDSRMDYWFN